MVRSESKLFAAVALLLLSCVAFGPGVVLDGWTGTEGRRAAIAHEMAQSGDVVVPTLGGEPTLTKPPLVYWLFAGCIRLADGEVDPILLRGLSVLALWAFALLAF